MSFALTGFKLLATAPVFLAEEAHEEAVANPVAFEIVPFVAALIIFVVVLAVLGKLVWPKILGGLDQRAEKIRGEIFAAEESRKKAAEAAKQHAKELAEAKASALAMIDAAKAEQARVAADLRAKSEAELAQFRESALASIEAAKRAAISELYTQMTDIATNCASKILRRELNPSDQANLVQEMMGKVTNEYAKR